MMKPACFTITTCSLVLAVSLASAAESPLADAVELQDAAAVHKLLDQKADLSAAQPDGMTALHWAAYNDGADTVKLLIAAGADVKAKNEYGVTPLAIACTNGNTSIVEQLLAAGADANAALPGGETVLMTASRTGRLGPVQALLDHGAKVDAQESKGQTAIMWAAADGHVEVVDALLDAGADFRTPLPSGFTPLFFAVREGRSAVVARLLEAGADVNETLRPKRRSGPSRGGSTTALILAVENGHFDLAAQLLAAGANPNESPAGYTALHAITWVRKPIRGDGDPPPIGSGRMNSLEMVRQLAAKGANLNARLEKGQSAPGRFTTTGCTPFVLAARTGDVPLLKVLLDLGADPSIPNSVNCTALMAAAGVGALENGDESAGTEDDAVETVRFLIELGANVNAVDDKGETAMHGAANQSWPKVIQLLVDNGADPNVWNRKNKMGWTPWLIAQGFRPGNFRPAPDTIVAIERVMRAAGVEIPPAAAAERPKEY